MNTFFKKLCIITLSLFTLNAFSAEKTTFEMLGELFQIASKPDLKMLVNRAWSGRCFNGFEQNLPYAGTYLLREKKVATKTVYEAGAYAHYSEASDYFDKRSFNDVLNDFTNSPVLSLETLKQDNSSLYTLDSIGLKITIKTSGFFLLSEFRGTNETENEIMRCYYFISNQ